MSSNYFVIIFIILVVTEKSQSLSKINIELRPYQYQYVNIEPIIPSVSDEATNSQTETITSTAFITSEDEIKPVKPKPKKLKRKTKKKPKKMHLRRIFKTRLITTTPIPVVIYQNSIDGGSTNNEVINLAPIYDNDTGISYTQDELKKICVETVHVSKNFGISDIDSFAKNNCFLIRLYYPNVTCSQINQLIDYCSSNKLFQV